MTTKIKNRRISIKPTFRPAAVWWVFAAMALFTICWAGAKDSKSADTDPAILTGRWVRPDGGYVLELKAPSSDGLLKAAYYNPQPIHVSHADWKLLDGRLRVFVELRDVNYPGSTYTLDYDKAADRLTGQYFQAVQRITYDIIFVRSK